MNYSLQTPTALWSEFRGFHTTRHESSRPVLRGSSMLGQNAGIPALRPDLEASRTRTGMNAIARKGPFLRTTPHHGHLWDGLSFRVGTSNSEMPASSAFHRTMPRNPPGAPSRMLRFKPAFCLTFLPGFSTVPFAERVMLFTDNFSVASMDEVDTSRALSLCRKSDRCLATRACSAASLRTALIQFRPPRFLLDTSRCSLLNFSSAFLRKRGFFNRGAVLEGDKLFQAPVETACLLAGLSGRVCRLRLPRCTTCHACA